MNEHMYSTCRALVVVVIPSLLCSEGEGREEKERKEGERKEER